MKLNNQIVRELVYVSFQNTFCTNQCSLSTSRKALPQATKRKLMNEQRISSKNGEKNPHQNGSGEVVSAGQSTMVLGFQTGGLFPNFTLSEQSWWGTSLI